MRPFGTGSTQAGERALGTMARADKGAMAPPPVLAEPMRTVADAVAGWPGVTATTHWHLDRRSQVDGIDFHVGEQELGHIHLDGSIHLATSPTLGKALTAEGQARPFRHVRGWVEEEISSIGADAAVALFRRNYDWVSRRASDSSCGEPENHPLMQDGRAAVRHQQSRAPPMHTPVHLSNPNRPKH